MSKPFVTANLDKPRKIKFTANALATLEDTLGKSMFAFLQDFDSGKLGIKDIRLMLWAGLQHESSDLTVEDAGNIMDEADFAYVCQKIGEALGAAFGNQKKIVETEMIKESPGTGETIY